MVRLVSFAICLVVGAAVFFTASSAEAAISPAWCTHATAQKLSGDVNGDGISDLVCHDRVTGQKWVALWESTGYEERWSNASLAWCTHANAVLFLADVNGDRRADLLCKDPTRVWIDYATSSFYQGTDWTLDTVWCTHTGAQFFLGDQNSDGRADLTCRDTAGYTVIDYADGSGHFAGTDVGRLAAELEVTNIAQSTAHTVTVRNNGAAAIVTRVECSHAGYFASRTVSTALAPGATTNVTILSLPVFSGTVECRVTGNGSDGQPELFFSNNVKSRTF